MDGGQSRTRVQQVMERAEPADAGWTLEAALPLLQRGEVLFFRDAKGWRAIGEQQVVGYPTTRRLFDLPSLPARSVTPETGTAQAADILTASPLPACPVVERDGRMVGVLRRTCLPEEGGRPTAEPARRLFNEMRNVLQTVSMTAQALSRTGAEPRYVDLLRRTWLAGQRVLDQMQKRPTSRVPALPGNEAVPVDLWRELHDELPALRPVLGTAGHVQLDHTPGLPPAQGPPGLATWVLRALARRLRLEMAQKGPAVQLRATTALTHDGRCVSLVVWDDEDRLDGRFRRCLADDLAPVYRSAARHAGELTVHQAPGARRLVSLTLPIQKLG